jgi:AcrR family transcriptional regulator
MVLPRRLPRSSPDERRDHIIGVAAQAFAAEGYGACSMSSIAARLGGSKSTLYKYFLSKGELFEAVMERRCEQVLSPLRGLQIGQAESLEACLTQFGTRFLLKIYEPESLDVHRLIQSEGAHFPELADVFFRTGPDTVIEELSATLSRFVASGQIACEDSLLAAGQFLGMLGGDRYLRFAMGLLPAPDRIEIEHQAAHAARIFACGLQPA